MPIFFPIRVKGWRFVRYFNIINLKVGDEDCDYTCMDLYKLIRDKKYTVLYDDTDERAGAKLARADLLGLPYQIIIGPRGIKEKLFDLKNRKNGKIESLSYDELSNFINQKNR